MFAWLAAGLIEGMLISLALMRTFVSRILLMPLFLISVLAASMSFVVRNEGLLNGFFHDRQMVEQLKSDLADTTKDFERGAKYTTKTLQRTRQLQDQLEQVLKGQNGDLALFNSCVFLVFVLILQAVSIYTATSLKSVVSHRLVSAVSASQSHENGLETVAASGETVRQEHENRRNGDAHVDTSGISETGKTAISERDNSSDDSGRKSTDTQVLKLKSQGLKPEDISRETGISRATVYRILKQQKGGPEV
ncbi:MAG: helix-turn-helix domain-containing protein [Nitrospirae bacterium]|nr:helix-turn-helix domain-containing protein [Nitrospirota bacterium]